MADQVVVPPPGPHGGDADRLARALGVAPHRILDLSATLNPLARPAAPVVAAVSDAAGRYPDPAVATAALAEAIGVDPRRLLLTNGGSEAIALVAADLRTACVVEPEFSLWRRHLDVVTADPGRRVRSNPNNPTGALAAAGEHAAVFDEAFYPLSTGEWTRGDTERGAIVVGSLTKLFACPGLRLGYVCSADPDLLARLRQRQVAWSVGTVALAALPRLLAAAPLERWASQLRVLRHQLVDVLVGAGLRPIERDAPWVLIEDASSIRDPLARRGVLVRDCASFGLPGTVRVAVPGPDGLARLEQALAAVTDGGPSAGAPVRRGRR